MFILQQFNLAVYEFLQRQFQNAKNGSKPEVVSSSIPDFDGAHYFISNKNDDRNLILLSLSIRYYNELLSDGADAFLRSEYAGYIESTPEDGFNVSLLFNLSNLPDDIDALAKKAAHLKRNCFASVCVKYFDLQKKLEQGETATKTRVVLHYRPDETLYMDAKNDRVTVIYSTIFKDTDAVTARLFFQEFGSRRTSQTAPQVICRLREPPAELKDVKDALVGENVGYITLVLFPRHTNPKNRNNTIDLLHIFRDYFHYHMKCSKSFLHFRFRHKTSEFLKVLNRAKPQTREVKTITGRTFIDPSTRGIH